MKSRQSWCEERNHDPWIRQTHLFAPLGSPSQHHHLNTNGRTLAALAPADEGPGVAESREQLVEMNTRCRGRGKPHAEQRDTGELAEEHTDVSLLIPEDSRRTFAQRRWAEIRQKGDKGTGGAVI